MLNRETISPIRKQFIREQICISREIRRRTEYKHRLYQPNYNQERINWLYRQRLILYKLLDIHTKI